MKIINPATEEVLQDIAEDDASSLQEKFNRLKKAQPSWYAVPLKKRVEVLVQFSSLLEKNIELLASVLTSEVGKPLQQSRNEVNGARARIKWLTENAEKYLTDEWMKSGENPEEKIVYEPLGVICNISAWNYNTK